MPTRNTRQKELVLSVLRSKLPHASASEIYNEIHSDNPSVSLATVYRILDNFSKDGTVRRVSPGDGCDRFDSTMAPHYHIVCRKCGRLEDVHIDYLSNLDSIAQKEYGETAKHDIIFSWFCENCR